MLTMQNQKVKNEMFLYPLATSSWVLCAFHWTERICHYIYPSNLLPGWTVRAPAASHTFTAHKGADWKCNQRHGKKKQESQQTKTSMKVHSHTSNTEHSQWGRINWLKVNRFLSERRFTADFLQLRSTLFSVRNLHLGLRVDGFDFRGQRSKSPRGMWSKTVDEGPIRRILARKSLLDLKV